MKFKTTILKSMLALALISGVAHAQEADSSTTFKAKLKKNLYLGAGLGSAFSYTDIKQYPTGAPVFTFRSEYGYGFNGFWGYEFNPVLALEGGLSYIRLNGTDRAVPVWFTSSVLQYDLGLRINLTNLIFKKSIPTRKFDIYYTLGIGTTAFRSRRHLLVNGVSTDPVNGVQGYEAEAANIDDLEKKRRSLASSISGGIGLAYRVNPKLSVLVDFKGYYTNTDYIDVTQSVSFSYDAFTYSSLGVTYKLTARDTVAKKSKKEQFNDLLDQLKDTDGDGVADVNDKDNKTPKGVKVYPDGTAIDTDGDGVADYMDSEKISPCKEVDASGKSKDGDMDGVADCQDKEPNTAKGAQVDANGKTINVEGGNEAAPAAPGTKPASGSSSTGTTPKASAGVAAGLPSVFFEMNSSTVSYKNYPALTQVAQYLKANPSAKLVLVGNSDKVGSAEYNKKLSEKRAQAVVDYLVKNNGVDKSRLSVVAKGAEEPISTKRNSEQNRRVDFMLSK